MSIDTKQLSERSQIKTLQATKAALERNLQKIQESNRLLEKRLQDEKHVIEKITTEAKEIKAEIKNFEKNDVQQDEK